MKTKTINAIRTFFGLKAITATDRIFNDLMKGERISQLDSKHYGIEDIRTPISHMRARLATSGKMICSRWIDTPVRKSHIKEYWVEDLIIGAPVRKSHINEYGVEDLIVF